MILLFACALACSWSSPVTVPAPSPPEGPGPIGVGDCSQAKNTCPDYAPMWATTCPPGERCLTFVNDCKKTVALAYEVGCDGDGKPGAPQCDCTVGPVLAPGGMATFTITDGSYASCLPSWEPPCLTAGLAVMAGVLQVASEDTKRPVCAGPVTRMEFTAGNEADPYGRFDSWNLDTEKGYGIPVALAPDLTCAVDHANHDCREVVCDSPTCPDAYLTPTTGGCQDGRSPQVGCQDTFSKGVGITATFCPEPFPPSCQDATPCP